MTAFQAPLNDLNFALRHIADLPGLAELPGLEAAEPVAVAQVLSEAGRFAAGVLAPLNESGDKVGARLENGVVICPPGFAQAYAQFRDGGWNAVPFEPEFGGTGLPWLVGVACAELWNAANMGFALCPLLTQGAVEAISAHGTPEQKATYLPNLVSGTWTGTMNLTEPQAGSDVGALRTRAEPGDGGGWRIKGQKIFITHGEHDLAENIVHLVLARTAGSPSGTKGISLFIVPKFLPDGGGRPGRRNDLRCVSIEHKLGIHASPTCVMSYGDDGGATGFMLGAENGGMRAMFTMMNTARLAVAVQGVAIAERAYQRAAHYARERRQGRAPGWREAGYSPIERHGDVRRMLMTMKALTEAARAVCLMNARALDVARHHPQAEERAQGLALADLLTPIAKGWATDIGCEVASLGVQVHGGMGFIEETGAAQYYRDARILPIYEGTNGIQAMDLLTRKLPMQGGEVVNRQIAEMRDLVPKLEPWPASAATLAAALQSLATASRELLARLASEPNAAFGGCTPYLKMWGLTFGGYLLAKGALAARELIAKGAGEAGYLNDRVAVARFFCEQLLPQAAALLPAALGDGELLFAVAPERLTG
ncbi:MAG: acyl-CoA dehydrogenase [Alphaproteobacteria bacterium]|nr:acyl-CoA dehydrogenase [Alphaproteobacteria bacterium]